MSSDKILEQKAKCSLRYEKGTTEYQYIRSKFKCDLQLTIYLISWQFEEYSVRDGVDDLENSQLTSSSTYLATPFPSTANPL